MSGKKKGKYEAMAKADKTRYEREGKSLSLLKGNKREVQGSKCTQKASLSLFLVFVLQIKGEHPGLSIGDVAKKRGEMWTHAAADDKQPYEKKVAKLKEKYEKDIAAYQAKGKPNVAKKGVVKAEKSKKKKEEEEGEEDEDEDEDDE